MNIFRDFYKNNRNWLPEIREEYFDDNYLNELFNQFCEENLQNSRKYRKDLDEHHSKCYFRLSNWSNNDTRHLNYQLDDYDSQELLIGKSYLFTKLFHKRYEIKEDFKLNIEKYLKDKSSCFLI